MTLQTVGRQGHHLRMYVCVKPCATFPAAVHPAASYLNPNSVKAVIVARRLSSSIAEYFCVIQTHSAVTVPIISQKSKSISIAAPVGEVATW